MPRITYTTTGTQDAIIVDPEHSFSYSVTSDAGTPVFTVQVRLDKDSAWVSPSSTAGTALNEAFTLAKPVSEMRLNISGLGGATNIYLDVNSVK